MGVDITTFRMRIGCCRHNVGTDVVNLTVDMNITKMSTAATKMVMLLLAIYGLLSKVEYDLGSAQHILLVCGEQGSAGTCYPIQCIREGNIQFSESLIGIGAVMFIRQLLLVGGVEPNPGPKLQTLALVSSTNIEHFPLPVFISLLSTSLVFILCFDKRKKDKHSLIIERSYSPNTCNQDDSPDICPRVFILISGMIYTLTSKSWLSRTCSYLLGNKGAHMTNGNPHRRDYIVKEHSVHAKEVQHSVGYIRLDMTEEYECQSEFYCHANGFRVGDCYMLTTYNVFRDRIESLIDNIAYEVQIVKGMNTHDILSILDMRLEAIFKTPRDVIKAFLQRNALDIAKLFSYLGTNLSKNILFHETNLWKKHCVVDFLDNDNKTTRFGVDFKIPFACEKSNLLIFKLLETTDDQRMPPQLALAEKYEQVDKMMTVRFKNSFFNEREEKIVVDSVCTVFNDDTELDEAVKTSVEWWKLNFPFSDDVISYDDCKTAQNIAKGQVILREDSHPFYGKSEGSPVVYVDENEYVFVGMICQTDFPMFYYEKPDKWDKEIKHRTSNPITNDVLFKGCTTLQRLAELLTINNRHDLKANILDKKIVQHRHVKNQVIADLSRTENYDFIIDELLKIPDLKEYRFADFLHLAKEDYQTTVLHKCCMVIESGEMEQLESFVETHFKTKGSKYRNNVLLIAAAKGSSDICSFLLQQGFPSDLQYMYEEMTAILFEDRDIRNVSPLSIALQFKKKENLKTFLPFASNDEIADVDQQEREIEEIVLKEIRKRLEVRYEGKSLGVVAGFREEQGILVVYKDSLDIDVITENEQTICGRTYIVKNPFVISESTVIENEPNSELSTAQIKVAKQIISENAPTLWSTHRNLNIITMKVMPEKDRITGMPEYCIVLACTSKGIIPLEEDNFPKTLSTNDNTHILVVKVEEGYFQMCPSYFTTHSKTYHQELKMGCSISPKNTTTGSISLSGSIGPFIDINGELGFLTCAHVLYGDPTSLLPQVVDVLQPETGSFPNNVQPFNTADEPCGKVERAIFNSQLDVSVDAAAVKITNISRKPIAGQFAVDSVENYKQSGLDELPEFNSGRTIDPMNMSANRVVVKCSKSTHLTRGILKCWGTQVRPQTYGEFFNNQYIEFKNQIEISNVDPYVFFLPGDSGSAVFQIMDDKSLECIGIAIGTTHGTSSNATIVTPISAILQALGPGISLKKFP